jgi:hypothetical protein
MFRAATAQPLVLSSFRPTKAMARLLAEQLLSISLVVVTTTPSLIKTNNALEKVVTHKYRGRYRHHYRHFKFSSALNHSIYSQLFLHQFISSFAVMLAVNLLGASALLWRVSLATLPKPPLQPNLDNLNQGLLDNLHSPPYTLSQWAPGWIAQDCATMTSSANLNPADVQTYNVLYADVCNYFIL